MHPTPRLLSGGLWAAGLHGLKAAAVVLPVAWTGAWLAYYAYTDTIRRNHIRTRIKTLNQTLSTLPDAKVDLSKPASEVEKDAIRQRFASLKYAGRYWNPYVEWREQGAWEWALWKMVISTLTLKVFYNGGVPKDRPIPDLPIVRPDFGLLFSAKAQNYEAVISKEEKGEPSRARGRDVELTEKFTMTWLGQSSSYVTIDGLAVLTDPALSDRTVPSKLAPQRLRPAPCSLDELRKIDVVLVSHNHYDHLDPEAIKGLGDTCQWIVPTGVGDFVRSFGVTRVRELDWWEDMEYILSRPGEKDRSFTITSLPLMHWSARSPKDTNASLWSAFHIRSHGASSHTFLHVGDTGFSPTLFEAVGRVLGPIDLAAVPIGAYEPRWHMHLQHTDPEGAVRMAQLMNIKKSIGVHWGTWLMSDEACECFIRPAKVLKTDNKPPIDLELAKKKLGMPEDRFKVVPVGKTIVVD